MIEEWLHFIVCLLDSCYKELGQSHQLEQLRGPALEVLNYAIGNEKSPAILLEQYAPVWPAIMNCQPEAKSVITNMVATWVWHVALSTLEASKEELKGFFQQPENHSRLRYLAVSPCHHYRLLLGIYWPNEKKLDLHEKIEPKNLLTTLFTLEEIQGFSKEIFEYPLSSIAIRQHTYRMRIELSTLFYMLMDFKLSEILEKLPGAPKSVIKASFGRLARILGDKNGIYESRDS